jgi:hypothetical protein
MTGGVLGRIADVDEDGLLAVDQPHRVGGGDPAAGSAVQQGRPEEQATGDERGGEEIPVLENEVQGSGSAASGRR